MALRNVSTDTHALRTPAGFAAAYRTHSRSILIFLARRTYDPETALDLTAETFAQAYADDDRTITSVRSPWPPPD